MERWGFLFSVMSSPIVYFLTILLAVCPNINPTILCAHVCDVNYAACYSPHASCNVLYTWGELCTTALDTASENFSPWQVCSSSYYSKTTNNNDTDLVVSS